MQDAESAAQWRSHGGVGLMNNLPPASHGLRSAKLLNGLNAPELEEVARQCKWRTFAAGQTICSRGKPDLDVYIVVGGRVRVTTYTASGKQVTLRDLGEGDSMGLISALDGTARAADVIALTDVVAALISPTHFRLLMAREPSVAQNAARSLAKLVRELTERVLELSTLGVQNRIHGEILRLALEDEGSESGRTRLLRPAPRHADIAARVSTTREQVAREFSVLTRRGLLAKHEKGLLVPDVEALRSIVEEARFGL
jgi:CRP/FNR family transcriptional regulator, cyclic AMP receptor protein